MRFVSRAAVFCLWCFVFVLPWDVVVNLPVLGSIPRIVGLVASGVGLVYILARQRIRLLSWFHVFAVLFVLWAGVSSFWSIDPEATQARFGTYLQLVVLVWLIWEIAWSPERGRGLLQAYVLGACVAAAATVYNYFSGVAYKVTAEGEGVRFVALNQDPNELGVILALGLPMAWYLSLGATPQRRIPWVWRLYIPLGLTATLLTASRAAFLTALVGLMIVPWTLGRMRLRTKVALGVLAVGSLAIALSLVPETSLERIQTLGSDIRGRGGTFGGRIQIWLAGLEVAREHPLVGVGAGAFQVAVAPKLPQAMYAHQTFLEILVEQGIVGFLLLLGMVAAAVKPLRQPLPLFQRRLWIVLLATLGIGSLTLHLGHRKQVWFVLGLLAAQVAERSARRTTSRGSRDSLALEPSS